MNDGDCDCDLFDVESVYHKENQGEKGDVDSSDVVPGRGLMVINADSDMFPGGKWALVVDAAGSPE